MKSTAGAPEALLRGGWGYLFAFLAVAATTGLRLVLPGQFGEQPVLILGMFPVILSVFLGGQGPGYFSTALVVLNVWLSLPSHPPSPHLSRGFILAYLGLFAACGALVSFLMSAWRRSRAELGVAHEGYKAVLEEDLAALQALSESEDALRRVGDLYRRLLETTPVGCYVVDGEGRILMVNDAFCRRSGYGREELLAMSLAELRPDRDQDGTRAHLAGIRDRGQDCCETSHRAKDGSTWPVEVVASHDPAEGGRFFVFAQDLTERRKAELALIESEQRFQDIARSSSDWFWEMDREGRFTYVSDSVASILGYEPGEMLGRSVLDGFPPEHRQGMAIRYGSLFAEGRAFSDLPAVLQCKDGTRRHTLSTGAPLRDEAGSLVGFRGLDRDVTEVKAAEAEQQRLEGELVQVQKLESIGRLAGGVAHDFNNMLGVILGQAEVAMLTPGSKPLHPFLAEITKAAQRSGELTRQLLAFARKQTITPKVLDLNETLQGMLKMLGRLIGEDIALAFVRKEGLWRVRMDPSQIDQILANLTVNARDAISGVGKVTITLDNLAVGEALLREHAVAVAGEFVVLEVADSGCGMDPDVLRHIFEPFFTTKEMGKGTGLGLATVFGIVKQNGGFILVDSLPGQGTRFRIFLPRHGEAEGEDRGQAVSAAIPVGKGQTILLVEDEPAVLTATRLLLEQLGYRVVPARGPVEALAFADTFKGGLDLLLTDVVMPEMNGRELTERILSHRPGLPVLYMSGYTADILSPHGVLEEGIHFLPKPATMVELAKAVDAILGGRPLV